ncbi:hypothetical protein [Rufibacter soli]
MKILWDYCPSVVLGMGSAQMAEALQWLPEPESFSKAVILAIATGAGGALGRWAFNRARQWAFHYIQRRISKP